MGDLGPSRVPRTFAWYLQGRGCDEVVCKAFLCCNLLTFSTPVPVPRVGIPTALLTYPVPLPRVMQPLFLLAINCSISKFHISGEHPVQPVLPVEDTYYY
eukprot:302817-Rhodomonas_salina.2